MKMWILLHILAYFFNINVILGNLLETFEIFTNHLFRHWSGCAGYIVTPRRSLIGMRNFFSKSSVIAPLIQSSFLMKSLFFETKVIMNICWIFVLAISLFCGNCIANKLKLLYWKTVPLDGNQDLCFRDFLFLSNLFLFVLFHIPFFFFLHIRWLFANHKFHYDVSW